MTWLLSAILLGIAALGYYVVVVLVKRTGEINLTVIGSLFFAGAGISPGIRVCYLAIAAEELQELGDDRLYVFFGGFAAICLCLMGIWGTVRVVTKATDVRSQATMGPAPANPVAEAASVDETPASGDGRERLIAIHDGLLILQDAWEDGFPAGKEEWRARVAALVSEAGEIIRTSYSQGEATSYRGLQPSDAKNYEPGRDETWERDFLLSARIAFIYSMVHGSGDSG